MSDASPAPSAVGGERPPWLTVAEVGAYLGSTIDPDDVWAQIVVASAMEWVESRLPDVDWAAPPAQVHGGAAILAGRWYVRRGSPNGIAGTFESGAYLPRTDRDIETMLGLLQPKVG